MAIFLKLKRTIPSDYSEIKAGVPLETSMLQRGVTDRLRGSTNFVNCRSCQDNNLSRFFSVFFLLIWFLICSYLYIFWLRRYHQLHLLVNIGLDISFFINFATASRRTFHFFGSVICSVLSYVFQFMINASANLM